jgi:hypothetical protein
MVLDYKNKEKRARERNSSRRGAEDAEGKKGKRNK